MIGNAEQIIQYLFKQDKEQLFEINEFKQKRSLNSNAYCWQMINKIANIIKKSKEELYVDYLKHYGQVSSILVEDRVELTGYFKYYEIECKKNIKGKVFKVVRIYKGSSEYDSKEMAIFIDGIVEEAKNLGIETMTPTQILELDNLTKRK